MGAHGRDADDEGTETLQGEVETRDGDEPSRSLEPSGRVDSLLAAIASAPNHAVVVVPGDRLADNFEIERRLGVGGMGIVYLAHHLVLDRKVAIKLHRTDSVKAAELLLREARAIASVEHEHVVVVHDVGTWQNYVFVAMEYVDGWTAREWVAQGRSWREVVALYGKAGRGLQAAHERGLTHRDFKPDNVLVGRDGRVRVADFGLARVAARADDFTTLPTTADPVATEGVVGSPGYMAPEQFRSGAVDARADQFGFCVSLFEALSGKRPFGGTTVPEIVHALSEEASPLASEHAPAHVRAVLRRGLQIDPHDRFPDMATLLAELGRDPARARRRALQWTGAIGGAAAVTWLLTRAPDPLVECRKTVRFDTWWDASTKRSVEAAFTAVEVPSASGSFTAVDNLLEGRREAARVALDEACVATHDTGTMSKAQLDDLAGCLRQSEREQAALVDLLLTQTVDVIDRSVVAAEALPTVARCTTPLGFRTDDVADADRERADELLRKIARVRELYSAGLYTQAVAEGEALQDEVAAFGYPAIEARLALDIAGAHQRLHHPDVARTPSMHALRLALAADDVRLAAEASIDLMFNDGYLDNQVQAGEAWTTLAEGLLERLGTPEDLHLRFLHAHALALREADRYPESLARSEEYLARVEESGLRGVRLANALSALGEGYRLAGKPGDAIAMLERSVAQYREALGDVHPSAVNALNVLGASRMHSGDNVGAERDFREALRLADLAPGGSRARLEIRGNLASILATTNRSAEGLALLEAAWADAQNADIPDDLKIGLMRNLGGMNDAAGHLDRARELMSGAVDLARRANGDDSIVYAQTLGARAQLERTDLARALMDAEASLAILRIKLGPDVVWTANARLQRAAALSRLDRCDEALPELDPVAAVFTKTLGAGHSHLIAVDLVRGICHARLGRHATAIAELEAVAAQNEPDVVTPELEGWLVRAYSGDGQTEKAAERYDAALRTSMTAEQRAVFAAIVPKRP